MIELLVKGLVGYLAGSVVGSLVLGPLRGVDIRSVGSGNAGGTNALRTQGVAFALGVVLIDVLKVVLPLVFLTGARLPLVPVAPVTSPELTAVVIAAAAVVGHVYPVWYGFRGGKGMATLLGAYAVLSPQTLAMVIVAWLVVLLLIGYVGLATMIAAASAPVWLGLNVQLSDPVFPFSVAMAVFIVFTHRSNIARLRAGNEHRMWRGLLGRRAG